MYSMKNVNASNKTFQVQLGVPVAGASHVHTLTIEEGLYDALDEIMDAMEKKSRSRLLSMTGVSIAWNTCSRTLRTPFVRK